jgi:nucleoside-diphosphate-sugar epimerase
VRAGVRDFAKGDALLEMAAEIKSEVEDSMLWPARLFQFLSPSQGKLELTECDLEKEDQIEVALGDAGVVICVVGASEKEVLDVTGPYRIDYKATKNLIDAASAANVKHFILVTSLGTAKFGWPASILK